ncbi:MULTISPECIES: hypothetical protein [unclassified Legionella]|nr:hypothetical protein [Legionella sp. PC997]QMT61575.1 hypothetical protein HBNCFIEN_02979 [Legionella sp. PC997]
MITNKLFQRATLIFYLLMTILSLSACANSGSSNSGIGEEYGTSDRGWH